MRRPAPLLAITLALAASALVVSRAGARRPVRASTWWSGLDAPREHATARGVSVLRPPLDGRVRVEGGSFTMGSSPTDMVRAVMMCRREILKNECDAASKGFRAEGPAHEVTLSSFEIDRTEVTVAAYARCVASGVCDAPGFTPGDARFDRPEFPVTHVRWDDARAFCAWAGERLPTEAEWEYTARGAHARPFPWGLNYNPHLENHGALAPDSTDATDGFVGLAPVGSFPDGATPLGVLDLSGNAGEWVADLFEVDDNDFGYPAASQVNPKGPTTGGVHVVRGGSYLDGGAWVRAAARGIIAGERSPVVGFRCAADPS